MERADGSDGKDSDDGDRRRVERPSTVTTTTGHLAMPGQGRAAKMNGTHLDLKALRLAVHGWWLGNPLVYKPGVADLTSVARELASAGAASGTLVLSDVPAGRDRDSAVAGTILDAEAVPHDAVHAVLILRPPIPCTPLGAAAAQTVAEVAQAALGRPCAVQRRWHVVLRDGGRVSSQLCQVSADEYEDVALVDVRLALGQLWHAAGDEAGQPAAVLFTRPDWREVFLARVLHALDGRLRALREA